ncbi:cytochrome c oxidase assembly protein [Rickettsiales bacterium]|nr:cytochrome c oxidase assembly protein [Rickettsiales bacterium]
MKSEGFKSKNKAMAIKLFFIALGMLVLAYASFPLYSLFCRVTGYGGTPKIAEESDEIKIGERSFKVRFNADVNAGFKWDFKPAQYQVEVKTGEHKLVFYTAENIADEEITGVATYNVTPDKAGYYFNKIACFCFNEQTLSAKQKVDMPISFFIDPDIENDPDLMDVDTITLSYTFFKSENKQ